MSVYVGFKIGKAREHRAYISEYYCGGCGWPVSDHDSYCPECGGAFRKEDATERTCKPEVEHHGDLILTRYPCCGYELKEYRYSPYPEAAFNNCPNCGAKVIGD